MIPLGFNFMVRKSRLNKSSMWLFDFKTRDSVKMRKCVKKEKTRPISNLSAVWSRKPEASKLPGGCRKTPY